MAYLSTHLRQPLKSQSPEKQELRIRHILDELEMWLDESRKASSECNAAHDKNQKQYAFQIQGGAETCSKSMENLGSKKTVS